MAKKAEFRAAIAAHHTGTSDAAWDGPAAEARLKLDQDEAYYDKAFAWKDSAGDLTKKGSYKFIHHEVSGDGAIGAANVKACQAGIGVLNGARGGTKIPAHDRHGVYVHLAAHLKDAKVEPPPLRAYTGELERRQFGHCEFRVAADGKKIEGHAAVFNSKASMGYFDEQVAQGAFSKTIQEHDVRALFNHDPNYVLGRNKADTLSLAEDSTGLAYSIKPPDTQWARDLMESMKRGDISQSSFGFRTIKDSWDQGQDPILRTINEVRLFDVSPVTFPAYDETDCAVRAMVGADVGHNTPLVLALFKLNTGGELRGEEINLIRTHIEGLEEMLDGRETASPKEPVQEQARHSVDLLRRRLELAAQED